MIPNWQTWPGFDFIFFDCDSTLSTIEGIDELARDKGKFTEIKQLTDAAMEGEVHLQSVYDRRLKILNPTRAEIRRIERHYRETLVQDAAEVIKALQFIGKQVFIVSGGLLAAVRPFGTWLGIPPENIRAVSLRYDHLSGDWWDYQQDQWGQRPDVEYMNSELTPLTQTHGKAEVVEGLLAGRQGRSVLIGDGVSDLAARPTVDMVIGFGGVIARPRVSAESNIFIKTNSLAPILPLVTSSQEQQKLYQTPHETLLNEGLTQIQSNNIMLNYIGCKK
ncbi:HAD-IB family phosphatase [Anaerolineales bacterium HSG6]|nr:HAD-IB family phosphatase [Anaerolineales bacterium HSG6]MDM8531439.1 HAD-IB family phosphatase [Anaerolineales bacterium HSG25]